MHSAEPCSLEYIPVAHTAHVLAPPEDIVPEMHQSHMYTFAVLSGWNRPAWQVSHPKAVDRAREYLPSAHVLQEPALVCE